MSFAPRAVTFDRLDLPRTLFPRRDALEAGLPHWARLMQVLRHQRVVAVDWQGVPAYAKRVMLPPLRERVLVAVLAPWLRSWLGVWREPIAPARRSRRQSFEVQRLAQLREAGCRVPRVLAVTDFAFVTETAGQSLENLLRDTADSMRRRDWLVAASQELAAFHAAGQWHGGAQVRNLAIAADGGFARFDFDDAFDEHLPLSVLQAIDVVLFLSSVNGFDDATGLAAIGRAYFEQASAPVLRVLLRLQGLVDRLCRADWPERVAPKEAARLRAVAAGFSSLQDFPA